LYIKNMTSMMISLLNEAILLAGIVIAEIALWYFRRQRKQAFAQAKHSARNGAELESLTLEYNKRNQVAGVFRLGLYLFAAFVSVLIYNIQAFSFLVLGFGAVLVVLRESVMSLIAYFYILFAYDVGDDIRIGETLGEISRISPLYMSVVGKDETGEYNGKLITVPNYMFFQQRVERQELKSMNYRRTSILWTYNRAHIKTDFMEIVRGFRQFLDELLPVRHADEIGYFRNYAGRRYRLVLDYNADGFPTIRVTFVAHPDDMSLLREKMIGFLESQGVTPGITQAALVDAKLTAATTDLK
jgi:small-conductance mechanosensitive channel